MTIMKVLTKSRYKLGLECPNKLFYTRKPSYADQKKEDSFLQALAEGGFQVEELARMHFPGGHLLEGDDGNYKKLAAETAVLMEKENVVIYEAAFLFENLFVRTDILVKKGNKIQLIEVKSKAYDPNEENLFTWKRGGLKSEWKPYLFDIAFQGYVLHHCYPTFELSCWIMMADKSKSATVNGLNQFFRISKNAANRTGIIRKVNSLEEIGNSVLGMINISELIYQIWNNDPMPLENISFRQSIQLLKNAYLQDNFLRWPPAFSACKNCEYKTTTNDPETLRSGLRECFTELLGWADKDFERPNIMQIWNFRKGSNLFKNGIYFMDQLAESQLDIKYDPNYLSNSERQWIQIERTLENSREVFLKKDNLLQVMNSWTFPLHFIDFETSAVALPFHVGRRPYEQIAFQFSHHMLHEDGSIEHATEFLQTKAGVFPNFEFIRSLKAALEKDEGTIFRYSHHENTIVLAIRDQLAYSDEPDAEVLTEFIERISNNKSSDAVKRTGSRNMVDLCDIVIRYYYDPRTNGSNSMKQVLPAMLQSSPYLREKYRKPIRALRMTSKNFSEDHCWISDNDFAADPYKSLPPIFEEWDEGQLENLVSELEEITDGGAALTAYAKLQFTDMSDEERNSINAALKKYCELDTLGMVMLYEGLRELVQTEK